MATSVLGLRLTGPREDVRVDPTRFRVFLPQDRSINEVARVQGLRKPLNPKAPPKTPSQLQDQRFLRHGGKHGTPFAALVDTTLEVHSFVFHIFPKPNAESLGGSPLRLQTPPIDTPYCANKVAMRAQQHGHLKTHFDHAKPKPNNSETLQNPHPYILNPKPLNPKPYPKTVSLAISFLNRQSLKACGCS